MRKRRPTGGAKHSMLSRAIPINQKIILILALHLQGWVGLDTILVIVAAVREVLVIFGLGLGSALGGGFGGGGGAGGGGAFGAVKVVGVVAAVGLSFLFNLGDAVRDGFRGDV